MQKTRFWQRRPRFPLVLLIAAMIHAQLGAESPSWPQFLGPHRNGVLPEAELMMDWPADGPEVLWRAQGGVGMSGVAVSGGFAITMWNSAAGQVLVALDPESGQKIWSTPLAGNYENAMGDGPRATPTISGDRVFAYTGDGVLACVQLQDGELIWTRHIVSDLGRKPAEYGMASSPLVVDDLVIVTAGGDGAAVIAADAASGKTRWSAVDGNPGYSSPALLKIADENQVVAFTGIGVTGILPKDGTVLWQYPFKTPYDCNTATPIDVDGKVFISAGENHGCVMLEIANSNGVYSTREAWSSVDVKSVMRNEWQTSVLIDGYLFGFDNVGSAGPITHLTCVEAKTGTVVWRETRFGKGNLVAAAGKLWITNMAGQLVLADATPSKYVELGRMKLFGKTRQAPSIAGGRAYVRDDSEIVCLKID